jgi:ABC-type glycerol-3-phosphate transport system permease component
MRAEASVTQERLAQDQIAARLRRAAVLRRLASSLLKHVTLILVGLVFALPMYWMVSTAVKPNTEMFVMPPKWIPSQACGSAFTKRGMRLAITRLTIPIPVG